MVRSIKKSILTYLIVTISVILLYSLVFCLLMFREGQHIPEQLENVNIPTAIYWVVTTMTTVGYGDIHFFNVVGRMFSIVVAISGVIIVFALLFPLVITPWVDSQIKSMLPTQASSKLSDHLIVCGYNYLVDSLIEELRHQDIPFVVVEDDEDVVKDLLKKGVSCIHGDPSERCTLEGAGIERARCLIANESDEMNANVVLTAREMDGADGAEGVGGVDRVDEVDRVDRVDRMGDLKIIAILDDVSKKRYLEYAGADDVITPKSMLGSFIGRKASDYTVSHLVGATEFLKDIEIVEFPIHPRSELIGKSLEGAEIRKRTGCNVIGMWAGGELSLNTKPTDLIRSNSILLAVGTDAQLMNLKGLTR